MNNSELFLSIYTAIALNENRLQDQYDDLFNVRYVYPTWHLNDISAQDFGDYKRLFGENLDVFLTKDGLKFERGEIDDLKRIVKKIC